MNIAIIGGGVSGLYAAYLLAKEKKQVTLFETSGRVGGAADMLHLNLGQKSARQVTRWADMGVNDFNRATYKELAGLLDELQVPYKPLSDTTAFHKLDGSVCYTLDEECNTAMPVGMKEEYARFMREAPQVLTDPRYLNYTVEDYLKENKYSPQFGALNIYPRINGMYFTHDTTPNTMPIRAVMHYYTLQEGFGAKAERMYFARGASSWTDALRHHAQKAGVDFQLDSQVQISASVDGVLVHKGPDTARYDACIIACHAKNALNVFRQGITEQMVSVLSAFDYCNSIGVAHNFTPLLPVQKAAWRTYNILVHDQFAQLRPYTISYVVNQHQNDMVNPQYNHYDDPDYFVTLNPMIAIPDQFVLKTMEENAPAIAYFPHNVMNFGAMAAQNVLPGVQGQHCVFFCGGWTHGAGLQEECLISAREVVDRMMGRLAGTHQYNHGGGAEHYAPQYIRDALSLGN